MRDYGKIKNYKADGRKISIEFEKGRMEVTVLTDEIINVFVPIWSDDHRRARCAAWPLSRGWRAPPAAWAP